MTACSGCLRPMLRSISDHGMLMVLVLLCAFFSWATFDEQHPRGPAAAAQLAEDIVARFGRGATVLVAVRANREDAEFAAALGRQLGDAGVTVADVITGQPADAARALDGIARDGTPLDAIACNHATASWGVFAPDALATRWPSLAHAAVVTPRSHRWPNFLKRENLLNVASQIVVIAILAVGMTIVIITGGIDLSVGSLIALAAVLATLLVRDAAGAAAATAGAVFLCCLAGIFAAALVGLFSGIMVTWFAIPPFIATLAMMLVASGLAFILAKGQSVYQVPDSFVWLGRSADLGLPNAVIVMLLLYAAAHVLMTRTTLGRYIYAVGGNTQAAWLSGVPVPAVLLFAYTLCGATAGLGGIVMASQLKSGSPTYGVMYELYTIAAVVVGGTSLSGGRGSVLGTLVGAFIIAVIQNGMNLTGVESYTQKVVLGLVILGAVLVDTFKKRGWSRPRLIGA